MHSSHDWTIAFRNPNAYTFRRISNWCGTWDESTKMADQFANMVPGMQVYYTCTQESELAGFVVKEDVGNILVDSGKRIPIIDGAKLPDELIQWAAENDIGHVPGKEHSAEFVLYENGGAYAYCSRHLLYEMRTPRREGCHLDTVCLADGNEISCSYDGYFS